MKIIIGDILKSKAQTLINTVNCIGVMGKGIALEFKNRFPDMFKDYVQRCQRQEVHMGSPYLYKSLFGPQIINFPTKEHWKSLSKVNDIEKGLNYLISHYKEWGIKSLAVPPLGCGNGQLEWKIVGPLIYKKLKHLDIPIEIYAPYGTSPRELTFEFLERSIDAVHTKASNGIQVAMNPAWIALVEILNRIEQQPYHWPIGRTIFQKIAYVATQEGLPTKFVYQKGSFGPFSKDLKVAESKLVNSNFLQEERCGGMFVVKVGTAFEKIHKDYRTLLEQWKPILDKTTDLFMRMNTKQAEIVATVLYATKDLKKEKQVVSEIEILEAVMNWKQKRRPPIDRTEVASTIRSLGILNWIDAKPENSLPVPEEYAVSAYN